jgi:hypothetical protein
VIYDRQRSSQHHIRFWLKPEVFDPFAKTVSFGTRSHPALNRTKKDVALGGSIRHKKEFSYQPLGRTADL